jgi:hypothetical protein
MYRPEDILKINENIDKIKEDAQYEYKKNNEPTLDETSNVCKAIIDYIKKKNRVVYGGYAQNLLIMEKNKDDVFYKEINSAFYNWPDLADIEFYSPTPIDDLIELTEELYTMKFNHIESSGGQHDGTYKIFVNFLNYCDISYIPAHIYNTMPIIKVDGIKCCDPHFMMVDSYRIFTDPMTSFWRLDKTIKRFQKIFKYYPIDYSNNNKKIELKQSKETDDFIRKKIIHNSKLIVVGFYGFDYYIKKSIDNYALNDYPFYELISTDLEKDAKEINKLLKDNFGGKIKVKEFFPFFTFMDRRVEFYYNDKLFLRLFGNNQRCIVYNYSDVKHTNFGTWNLVIMYLYFDYYLAFINKDKANTSLYLTLIGKFYHARKKFLDDNSLTVVDDSPFRDFTYKCYGEQIDPKRQALLDGLEKRKKNKPMKYRYNPTGKPGKAPEYTFDNTSGNQILNEKNFIIKK